MGRKGKFQKGKFCKPSSSTRPVKADTTDLVDKSSLFFIPSQILLSSNGKTTPTTSSPTTNTALNSSTIAKDTDDKGKEKVDDAKTDDGHDYERGTDAALNSSTIAKNTDDKGKEKVDDAKTDEGHDYEIGADVKSWSPSMDGIAEDVQSLLNHLMRRNSRFTNEGASEVTLESNELLNKRGDGIAEKILYGSGRSSLPVFEEMCREENNQAMCEKKVEEVLDGSGEITWPELEDIC